MRFATSIGSAFRSNSCNQEFSCLVSHRCVSVGRTRILTVLIPSSPGAFLTLLAPFLCSEMVTTSSMTSERRYGKFSSPQESERSSSAWRILSTGAEVVVGAAVAVGAAISELPPQAAKDKLTRTKGKNFCTNHCAIGTEQVGPRVPTRRYLSLGRCRVTTGFSTPRKRSCWCVSARHRGKSVELVVRLLGVDTYSRLVT